MENLLSLLSPELQAQMADYGVNIVFVEYNEMNVRSNYMMDMSYYEAIEEELKKLGKLF